MGACGGESVISGAWARQGAARKLLTFDHMTLRKAAWLTAAGLALSAGCAGPDAGQDDSNITSRDAVVLEFEFQGRAVVERDLDEAEQLTRVEAQLFYLAGVLDKKHSSHGRFGFVELSERSVSDYDEGHVVLSYTAKLPVAWDKGRSVPDTFRVRVPMRADDTGLADFNDSYAGSCGDAKYGEEFLWYDFLPDKSSCELTEADILDVQATVRPSPQVTTKRYPEFPRFWEDGEFRVVVVHGTSSAWGLDPSDGNTADYLGYQKRLVARFPDGEVERGTTTQNIWDSWHFEADVTSYGGGEGRLVVDMMLTSALKHLADDSEFDARYDPISADADLIIYEGHSGLSKNIKSLAGRGIVKEGQYQVMFFHGCSTFAYLDRSVHERRTEVNGAEIDPNGTKFLDVIVSGQPTYAGTGADAMDDIVGGLSATTPRTYLELIEGLYSGSHYLVAGEEDNPTEAP